MKNPASTSKCHIRYFDIGDYLSREEKLKIIKGFGSVSGIEAAKKWTTLSPNRDHDWINQRDPSFERFAPIGEKDDTGGGTAVFAEYSMGVVTGRDNWVYNASLEHLKRNISTTVAAYKTNLERYANVCSGLSKSEWPEVDEILDFDNKKISWTRGLKSDLKKHKDLELEDGEYRIALYRPFVKRNMFFSRRLNEMVLRIPKFFPTAGHPNVCICITGQGNRDAFGVIIADTIPDLHFADKSGGSQCFPLYIYERADGSSDQLFDQSTVIDGYRRRDAITDAILETFRRAYGNDVTKEDIFYYVYGVLHSPEYRTRFAADLKKMLPRIPLTKETTDFRAFSKAGRELSQWHLKYETVAPWPVEELHDKLDLGPQETYKVDKMRFERPTPSQKTAGEKWDKTRIVFNSQVTISKIPLEAYDYVVNGKPAIEWITERYQVTRDKDSGIVNDPNDWCREHNQPRYIIDLIARVVRVSMETMKIVNALPPLNERNNGATSSH